MSSLLAALFALLSKGRAQIYSIHQLIIGGGTPVSISRRTNTTSALFINSTFWVSVSNSAGAVVRDKATVKVVSAWPQLSIRMAAGLPVLTLAGLVDIT